MQLRAHILTAPVLLPCLAVLAFLCSCATPYRPVRNNTGYSDRTISSNQFQITFQGNGNTPLERAYDFALLHCAEVAQEHGFSHFAVVDVINLSSAKRYTHRQTELVDSSWMSDPNRPMVNSSYDYIPYLLSVTREEQRIYFKPGITLTITRFTSKREKTFTYEAAELKRQLQEKYRL